jgi:hypothetical protein
MQTQPFGYTDQSALISAQHNVYEVLLFLAQRYDIVFPVGGNRPGTFARNRALVKIFCASYKTRKRTWCPRESRARVFKDARRYFAECVLPYYVIRDWYGRIFGEERVRDEIARASRKSPVSAR